MTRPRLTVVPLALVLVIFGISLALAESPPKQRAKAIYAPKLEFSYDVLKARPNDGLFEAHVRPDGTVSEVVVLKSTGLKRGDNEAIAILKKWRMEPGTPVKKIVMPAKFARH